MFNKLDFFLKIDYGIKSIFFLFFFLIKNLFFDNLYWVQLYLH